jgi:hypothetical protein
MELSGFPETKINGPKYQAQNSIDFNVTLLDGNSPAQSQLNKLEYLLLNGNQLCGQIPSELKNLSKIKLPDDCWNDSCIDKLSPVVGNKNTLPTLQYLATIWHCSVDYATTDDSATAPDDFWHLKLE